LEKSALDLSVARPEDSNANATNVTAAASRIRFRKFFIESNPCKAFTFPDIAPQTGQTKALPPQTKLGWFFR
jgi:hypothetical protein